MVHYFHSLWTNWSEILTPLRVLTEGRPTKNGPIKWTPDCTEAETGWFEFVEVLIIDQSSGRIYQISDKLCISRYPRPFKVIYDNGSEFNRNFIIMLNDFSVKPTCTTIKNPQENPILEKTHRVFGSILKTKDLANAMFDAVPLWSKILASIAYAVRCSYHSTLQATPGKLVFVCNMLLDWFQTTLYTRVLDRPLCDTQGSLTFDIFISINKVPFVYNIGSLYMPPTTRLLFCFVFDKKTFKIYNFAETQMR